jgi:hypothetical protein
MDMRNSDALSVADDAVANGAAVIAIPESSQRRSQAV